MDSVGVNTNNYSKNKFKTNQHDRLELMLRYIGENKNIRDVVVSGGDLANVQLEVLKNFVIELTKMQHVKDIRLATKSLGALPQYFLQKNVLECYEEIANEAHKNEVDISIHTHINNAQQVTPMVAEAAKKLENMGYRLRNQTVLLRGVNNTFEQILSLCYNLIDNTPIEPYYLYVCDMIPNSEHWRTSIQEAEDLAKK